jgi:hypothetical protein
VTCIIAVTLGLAAATSSVAAAAPTSGSQAAADVWCTYKVIYDTPMRAWWYEPGYSQILGTAYAGTTFADRRDHNGTGMHKMNIPPYGFVSDAAIQRVGNCWE